MARVAGSATTDRERAHRRRADTDREGPLRPARIADEIAVALGLERYRGPSRFREHHLYCAGRSAPTRGSALAPRARLLHTEVLRFLTSNHSASAVPCRSAPDNATRVQRIVSAQERATRV